MSKFFSGVIPPNALYGSHPPDNLRRIAPSAVRRSIVRTLTPNPLGKFMAPNCVDVNFWLPVGGN